MTQLALGLCLLAAATAAETDAVASASAVDDLGVDDAVLKSSTAAPEGPRYLVGPGDVIAVNVYGEPDLSGAYAVTEDGRLDLPLVGAVDVAGRSTAWIDGYVTRLLARDYLVDPQVTVGVEEYGSKPVKVLGAVAKPGRVNLTGPTRVLDLLAEAGDVAEDAGDEVHLKRAGKHDATILSLDRLRQVEEENLYLQAGDVLYVPKGLVVYVAGEVEEPGSVGYREGLTVVQAVTQAGGPTGTAKLRDAYVLRDGETIEIDLKAVMRGRRSDLVLRPDDQIWLKESAF